MYDLKVNYAFVPHKRDANKPTVGNFGLECLAWTGKELQSFPGQSRLTLDNSRQRGKTGVNKTETIDQLNKKIRLIRSAIHDTLVQWYLQQQITLSFF